MTHCQSSLAAALSLALLLVATLAVATPRAEISGPASISDREALQEAERMKLEYWADARQSEQFGPFYSIAGGDATTLFLLNKQSEVLYVELSVLDPTGTTYGLGQYTLEPQTHLAVDLAEALRHAGQRFQRGSVRAAYYGKDDTLQAWAVLRRGGQLVEIPFVSPGAETSWQALSFWDAGPLGKGPAVRPAYYLTNAGERPLTYQATFGRGDGGEVTLRRQIAPGEQQRLEPAAGAGEPPMTRGWLELRYDGEPGSLVGTGLLEGADELLALAWSAPSELAAEYQAVRVPLTPAAAGGADHLAAPVVTLFNPARQARSVTVELLEQASGRRLAAFDAHLAPRQVTSVGLDRALDEAFGDGERPPEVRLGVRGDGGLLAAGFSNRPGGARHELSLFATGGSHPTGSYPLPNLEEYEVIHTFVNLGQEAAEIVAQVNWPEGAYAIGPITVEPGASYRLDLTELAASGPADVLGRRLDPAYRQGFLSWLSQRGSTEIIARAEVRPRDGADAVGFNCFGCCFEQPYAVVVPSSVDFLPGQTPPADACAQYATCNGTIGPYPVTSIDGLTVPWPFLWDGTTVGATDPAQDELQFSSTLRKVSSVCQILNNRYWGNLFASSCDGHNINGYDPLVGCSSQFPLVQTCGTCCLCCMQLYEQQACKCGSSTTCHHQATTAFELCTIHCAEDLNCNQVPYCPQPPPP